MAEMLPPSLMVPQDQMELGSDYGNNDGNDFDIDLDFPEERDEDMTLEDAGPEEGMTQDGQDNDDIMFDGDNDHGDDKSMQDNITIEDEDLNDADEIGYGESTLPAQDRSKNTEDNDIISYSDDEDFSADRNAGNVVETSTAQALAANAQSPTYTSEKHSPPSRTPLTDVKDFQVFPQSPAQEQAGDVQEEPVEIPQQSEHVERVALTASPSKENETINAEGGEEYTEEPSTANQESPKHLHPVTVNYGEDQMSLFPDQNDYYLLGDEFVGHETLNVLLQACREQLSADVGEGDEIVFEFQQLNSSIGEDSDECRSQRLTEILDVYTLLCQQDDIEEPEPLIISIYTRSRFSYRINQLKEAACDGKGMSQLTFLRNVEGDDSEYHENEVGDGAHGDQGGFAGEETENAHDDGSVPEGHYDEGDQYQGDSYTEHAEGDAASSEQTAVEHHQDLSHDQSNDTSNIAETNDTNNIETATETHPEVQASDKPADSTESTKDDTSNTQQDSVVGNEQRPAEEDLIEYSDEEAEEPEAANIGADEGHSAGSSTIQGDAVDNNNHQELDNKAEGTDPQASEYAEYAKYQDFNGDIEAGGEAPEQIAYDQSNFNEEGYEGYGEEDGQLAGEGDEHVSHDQSYDDQEGYEEQADITYDQSNQDQIGYEDNSQEHDGFAPDLTQVPDELALEGNDEISYEEDELEIYEEHDQQAIQIQDEFLVIQQEEQNPLDNYTDVHDSNGDAVSYESPAETEHVENDHDDDSNFLDLTNDALNTESAETSNPNPVDESNPALDPDYIDFDDDDVNPPVPTEPERPSSSSRAKRSWDELDDEAEESTITEGMSLSLSEPRQPVNGLPEAKRIRAE